MTTVVYSTESGNLTASTLIQMFQDSATGRLLSIGNQTATIINVCSPACMQQGESGLGIAAIIGMCVGSLLIVIIIVTVIIW